MTFTWRCNIAKRWRRLGQVRCLRLLAFAGKLRWRWRSWRGVRCWWRSGLSSYPAEWRESASAKPAARCPERFILGRTSSRRLRSASRSSTPAISFSPRAHWMMEAIPPSIQRMNRWKSRRKRDSPSASRSRFDTGLIPNGSTTFESNLPQPVEKEIVPAVVASAWRELVPNYTVRDVFSVKREEVRKRASDVITQKLGADGLIVKEVMLRDIQLPPEFAKGLESLLLKEQENDRMGVETEIQQKQVRIAELQAEATKAQQVKQAEGEAQVRVLQAKSESDAMQVHVAAKAEAD